MGIELVTGYAGKGHVSSLDVGRFNAGMAGDGAYVMETGTMFRCSMIDNNTIRIESGDLVKQGRHFTLAEGEHEELTLLNGRTGWRRIDLVVVRYEKNSDTGIETARMAVIDGKEYRSDYTPVEPGTTQGDLHSANTLIDEIVLYAVHIEGQSISEIVPKFNKLVPLNDIWELVYPIGSIYMSMSTISPQELFGGRWLPISARFLFASSRSYGLGETGGEESTYLTTDNLPEHKHGMDHTHPIPAHTHNATVEKAGWHTHNVTRTKLAASGTGRYAIQTGDASNSVATSSAGLHEHKVTIEKCAEQNIGIINAYTENAGNGTPVNNMPPYLVVNMWERIG